MYTNNNIFLYQVQTSSGQLKNCTFAPLSASFCNSGWCHLLDSDRFVYLHVNNWTVWQRPCSQFVSHISQNASAVERLEEYIANLKRNIYFFHGLNIDWGALDNYSKWNNTIYLCLFRLQNFKMLHSVYIQCLLACESAIKHKVSGTSHQSHLIVGQRSFLLPSVR